MPINPVLVILVILVLWGLSNANDVAKYSKGCATVGAIILLGMLAFAVATAISHDKVFFNPFGG